MSNGSRPPVGPTPTLVSIFRDLARPTPRIENLGVGSHTKVFGVGFVTRSLINTLKLQKRLKTQGLSVIFCPSCLCFLGLATCGCCFITRCHVYRSRGCYAAEATLRWQCHTEPNRPQPSVGRWISDNHQNVVKRGNPCLGHPGLRSLQG